ncbi:uncharacterized protein [Periplaneta americana]|uniref:uncharacterized protein n=1 Tax=Periplaneta americana TaxID=6978 RepID=UPI0037E9021E
MGDDDNSKPTWREVVVEEQQLYYEIFGDRDWDVYKENELEFLERNVGHALYGPPEELPDENKNGGTGYSSEKLKLIRNVCATIKEHSCHPECGKSDVWVAMIFVSLNMEERSLPIPIFRIPKVTKESSCNQFVDSNCRVYKDWNDFLKSNMLPRCTYCYPQNGVYDGDENDKVLLEFGDTPACKFSSRLCSVLDTTSTVVMVGGMAVSAAAIFTTVAAPLAAATAVGSVATGVYGTGRSAAALADRGAHQQSVGLGDAEARSCWLSVLGNSLGIASGQAVRAVTKMARNGEVVCRAGRIAVTALNFGSLTVNGLGLVNGFLVLREKSQTGKLTRLEVFQFASSLLFFTMSAVNVKTADALITEAQNGVIGDFEASLRSNRHRRVFRRVAKQTQGEAGNSMEGNAKVIRGITHIDNKDDFFAGLVRVQKQLGKSKASVKLTDNGMVSINDELHLHPMRFWEIEKVQRQVILDATKNLNQGAWTQEQFDLEMQTICQDQNIVFESQRPHTVATLNEVMYNSSTGDKKAAAGGKNNLSNMTASQIDMLSRLLINFAKEYHAEIISVAIKVAEGLGYEKTADILKVVQFVVNYVKQVVSEVERKYQEDLRAAQLARGADFNREQFDRDYHIQGNRFQHFTSAVLTNYNTYEAIRMLEDLYIRYNEKKDDGSSDEKSGKTGGKFTAGAGTSGSNGNKREEPEGSDTVDVKPSSVEEACGVTEPDENGDCWLYKQYRNFKKHGDPSDEEIYEIAQEVTGLYLFKGNSLLSRCDNEAFISVNDSHVEPLTVMICFNRNEEIITASIIF